ncbi:MAG TPA: nuclear transport factor 2 family protein [Burkholderiales bacterium]|nr:nuclear transport factor 2 family protein [Burkholderiales bacterium]
MPERGAVAYIGGGMPAEKAVLTAELRLDVQEFYARYAECLDGGRLQQWPEFFLEACVYRITTRRNLRLGPDQDLVSLSSRTAMFDRIVAIGQSEDYEPHMQRHTVSGFRIQAASGQELRAQANFQILRTFPEQRSEHFVSGSYNDRIAVAAGRLHFREKICVLDSDVAPTSLVYPI